MDCKRCLAEKPTEQFTPVKKHYAKRGRHHWCRDCRNEYQRNYRKEWTKKYPERRAAQKRRNIIRSYGLTPERHAEMLSEQGNACAICRTTPDRDLDIDHCHATGKVRGLLCSRCNMLLGMADDDAEILSRAVQYLSDGIK